MDSQKRMRGPSELELGHHMTTSHTNMWHAISTPSSILDVQFPASALALLEEVNDAPQPKRQKRDIHAMVPFELLYDEEDELSEDDKRARVDARTLIFPDSQLYYSSMVSQFVHVYERFMHPCRSLLPVSVAQVRKNPIFYHFLV